MSILEELEQQLASIKGQIAGAREQLKSEHSESSFRSYLDGKLIVLTEMEDFISYMIDKVQLDA